MGVRRSTKGIAQFNETILVLFVVVILIALGMFMYYRYSIASIENIGQELTEEEASVLLAGVTNMPELRCTDVACLDIGKAIAFKRVAREHLIHYTQFFGSRRIILEQIYPEPAHDVECTLQHFNQLEYPTNCKQWVIYDNKKDSFSNKVIVSTPISFYYPHLDKYGLGKIILEVYR